MSTTNYSYDRADRITTAGSTSYSVNANGNETARGSDTFSYDQANRLKSATAGGVTSTYVYDGDGKRVSKTVGGTTTSYVYDVGGGLPVLLDDGSRKYVWGAGGLAYGVDKSSSAAQVYHTDGLGSVRAITDSSGNVVQTYQTDEFGSPTQSQGSLAQPFGYTGEQRDPENGLVYLRARMYDPGVGRFLQRDSLPGTRGAPLSLNRFAYAMSNPVLLIDPAGLSPIEEDPYYQDDCQRRVPGPMPVNSLDLTCTNLPVFGDAPALVDGPGGPMLGPGIFGIAPFGGNGGTGKDRIAGTRGLLHSFDEHAAQWFGRFVARWTHLQLWRRLSERAAQSTKVVDWSVQGWATSGHLARLEGKWFFVQFFKEGDRAGELATAFIPNQNQLSRILELLGH